jgi:hypothetical protein
MAILQFLPINHSYHLGRGPQEEKYKNPYKPRITPPPKMHNQYDLDLFEKEEYGGLPGLGTFGKL